MTPRDKATLPVRLGNLAQRPAIWFVVLLGIVSLFGDMTYEGARSITGPYLAVLGANGTIVGIVAGTGELVGYGLRLVSGLWADTSRRYWSIVFVGYVINLGAVPLLALTGNWPLAAGLMIAERAGKAVRTPSRDAMLSHATHVVGRGWGFGLHEAMDQTGALIGPLAVTAVLSVSGRYDLGFAALAIPAALSLSVLVAARYFYPHPGKLENISAPYTPKGFPRVFWWYLAALALVAAGYADFPLIAFHFEAVRSVPQVWIPIFYAAAMASAALAALLLGRLFDAVGVSILIPAVLASSPFAILVFGRSFYASLIGMVLWGVGMGAQESVVKAFVAEIIPRDRRASAYGILNFFFGVAWFAGSVAMGVLYDVSIAALITFSVACELAALPILLGLTRSSQRSV